MAEPQPKARFWKYALYAGTALWAGFVLIASNSPKDVSQRLSDWLAVSVPILGTIFKPIIAIASNSITIAITFLAIGIYLGWKWKSADTEEIDYRRYRSLGNRMNKLDVEMKYYLDFHELNAEIDVINTEAKALGLDFPSHDRGFLTPDSLKPYLKRVSAHLRANQIQQAKTMADQLAQAPFNG